MKGDIVLGTGQHSREVAPSLGRRAVVVRNNKREVLLSIFYYKNGPLPEVLVFRRVQGVSFYKLGQCHGGAGILPST